MSGIFGVNVNGRFDLNDINSLKKTTSLEELFKQIYDIVKSQLDIIIMEENKDEKYISQWEYVNEFAS